MNQPKRQLSRAMETKRFVVSVDHQAKRSYDTRAEAEDEARKISTAYPVVAVQVTDVEQGSRDMAKLAPAPGEFDDENADEASEAKTKTD